MINLTCAYFSNGLVRKPPTISSLEVICEPYRNHSLTIVGGFLPFLVIVRYPLGSYGPFPVTVTTRINTFLVGNPYKPLFVTGKGPHPRYPHCKWVSTIVLPFPWRDCFRFSEARATLLPPKRRRTLVSWVKNSWPIMSTNPPRSPQMVV